MEPESSSTQCIFCFKVFRHRYYLNRHLKVTHGGFRPHKCKCGKAFATREQLARHHSSKHSLEKPYPCERGCDRSFASYTARAYHHSAVHDKLKFVCPIVGCTKQYSAKENLKNHLLKPHGLISTLINLCPW